EVSRRSRFLWGLIDALRFFTSAKVRLTLIIALTMAALSFAGIWYLSRPFGWAVYESLLDVAGSAVPDTYGQPAGTGGTWQRVAQGAVPLCGIPLMAVVTAVLV